VASLSITDNASGSPQPVSLSGTGTQPGPTGHTYYVDNCVVIGSDANNGTSTATPWLTVNKVNTSTFNPGDSILFESTCTWREQLTVPSSGSSGSPITFGSYGTGAAPIISGGDVFSSWITEATIYYSPASTQPNQVFRDGTRLTLAASKAALTTGDWWWDSVNLRIYVYDNPSGHTFEASQRNSAIVGSGVSYVTVTNIQTQEANQFNIYFVGSPSPGLIIGPGVASVNSYNMGIYLTTVTGALITQSTSTYSGANGFEISLGSSSTEDRLTANYNCAVPGNDYCAGLKMNGTGTGTGQTNNTIQYSRACYNGIGQADQQGAGLWMDTMGAGTQILYNFTCNNLQAGIFDDANPSQTVILGNVSVNNGQTTHSPALGYGIWSYIDWQTTALTNKLIYNNTVVGNADGGIVVQGAGRANDCENNTVENNISTGTTAGPNLYASFGCENAAGYGAGNVYTYNDFGSAATSFIEWGAGAYYSTYAAWEAATGNCGTTGCSHSVQANPLYENTSASQYWLQSGSPAIDVGANLGTTYDLGLLPAGSWPNSVVTGDQNSYGTGWELGAYIFTGQ
jgi:parallel beta-helix repeat protein